MTKGGVLDLITKLPLYEKRYFEGDDQWEIIDLKYFTGTYDIYCIGCHKDSTFKISSLVRPPELIRKTKNENQINTRNLVPAQFGVFTKTAVCSRNPSHIQHYFFNVEQETLEITNGDVSRKLSLEKIGQKPSYADIHLGLNQKYKSVLTSVQFRELNRAVGLAAHGVGIGSYVYLRRIFEALIEETHELVRVGDGWDERAYSDSKMKQKIQMLREHLPKFLVENSNMYSLLSLGIHELSDSDCLKYFDILKIGIQLLLDEKLEIKERKIRQIEATQALNKAIGETNKNK